MIAAGIDMDDTTCRIVKITYGPRGVTSCETRTMPSMDFDAADIEADVVGIDRWRLGCSDFKRAGRVVCVPYLKAKRASLLERYEAVRPDFMQECSPQAAVNAFAAAFGGNW